MQLQRFNVLGLAMGDHPNAEFGGKLIAKF